MPWPTPWKAVIHQQSLIVGGTCELNIKVVYVQQVEGKVFRGVVHTVFPYNGGNHD